MKKLCNWHSCTVFLKTVQFEDFFHQRTSVFLILKSFFETIRGFIFRENRETLFTEICWYSWVKIWPKITKWMVSKETPSYFILFLLTVFSETRTKKWWYSRVSLEIRTWKPVVVFIETRVFLVEICLRQTPPKKTRFQWNHQGFKFLLQSNTWNHHFSVQVSLKPSTKKKWAVSP